VRVYDGGGTPQKQNAAMLDAISAGADAIVGIAIDPNLVQQGLRAAKKANVLAVSGSNGIDTPNPVQKPDGGKLGYAFDVGPDYAALGRKAAEWIIGDSKGKANIAVFSDKEFPSVIAFQNGLLAGLKGCSGCKVSPLQYFNGTQVGTTLGSQTTGYLRSNPDVDYVFSPYDPAAAAQVTAIAQAGMANRVKVVGVLGSQQNVDFIRKGQVQAADAAYDNRYMGYMIADQIIRKLAKKPLFEPHGGNMPFTILDKQNLPAAGSDWTASFDYPSKFSQLWGG
jgi:ribose transport system substrate-binding protein